jgi:REP element-mobilizing transposase RayT
MPYVKIWVHTVWGTKNRQPLLTKDIRNNVFQHIKSNAKSKGIFIDAINGYLDHTHCLISLQAEQCIATVMNLIKGESSYWINKNKVIMTKFEWADEYYAGSISPSHLEGLRKYIGLQEEHHRHLTFQEECERFLKAYNLIKDQPSSH